MKKYNQFINEAADYYDDDEGADYDGDEALDTICPTCHGEGYTNDGDVDDGCPTCGGEGYLYGNGGSLVGMAAGHMPYMPYMGGYSSGPSTFREGEDIVYMKDKSKHHGKPGTFLKVREDGKYSLKFDDGTKFAADGKYVFGLKRMK
jgi:hypothetical protein